MDQIGTYRTTLETSGCVRSLDWSHRLMLVMSYHNRRLAPRSTVMLAAAIKGSR